MCALSLNRNSALSLAEGSHQAGVQTTVLIPGAVTSFQEDPTN